MFGSLDISASALVAQRGRLNTISSNLANSNAIYDADGNYAPFRRRIAVFAPGDPASGSEQGVHLKEILLDQSPLPPLRLASHGHRSSGSAWARSDRAGLPPTGDSSPRLAPCSPRCDGCSAASGAGRPASGTVAGVAARSGRSCPRPRVRRSHLERPTRGPQATPAAGPGPASGPAGQRGEMQALVSSLRTAPGHSLAS